MSRGLTSEVKSALGGRLVNMATLVKLELASGDVNMTDYGTEITNVPLLGFVETYQPSDFLLDYGEVSESSALQVGEVDLTLSAVDRTYSNLALSGEYLTIRVTIARCVLNVVGEIVGNPWIMFRGNIKGFEITDNDDSSEVVFSVASHWADFEKVNCRRTNKVSQQRYFPNDTGLNWAADAVKELKWGRKDY